MSIEYILILTGSPAKRLGMTRGRERPIEKEKEMPDFPVKQKPPASPKEGEEKKKFLCICGSTKCTPVEVGSTFAGPIRYNGYICAKCTIRFFDKDKMTAQAKKLHARLKKI